MNLLDGRIVSEKRLQLIKNRIDQIPSSSQRPGLTVFRVGNDPASEIYVRKKIKTCTDLGIRGLEIHLPADISEAQLKEAIETENKNPNTHGILLQLPLPKHLKDDLFTDLIHPLKDVDGFHTLNRGYLLSNRPTFVPCTPMGVMTLLRHYSININGMNVVVIGRSLIVGRPMSLLLDQAGGTVTVVHSQSKKIDRHLKEADLIVVAAGKRNILNGGQCKKGVIVVDVGIHRTESGKIVGDIDFESFNGVASWITPVPGGVGPMTICSLMENVLMSYESSEII